MVWSRKQILEPEWGTVKRAVYDYERGKCSQEIVTTDEVNAAVGPILTSNILRDDRVRQLVVWT